jgi:hypothetical protein
LFDKTWDTSTNRQISSLDPRLQNPAADFINDVNDKLRINLRVTFGSRSIEEQNTLYAIGRDANGKVIGDTVTNAKGGQSYHNYGLAIDVVAMEDNNKVANFNIVPSNPSLVNIGKSYGFEWGGDWKKKDNPHFENTFGEHWSDLFKQYIAGQEKK